MSTPPSGALGLPLVTGAQAGEADAAAVEAGDTWDGLLARAGGALARGVVEELRARTGGVYGRRVLVVAGKGDNGGDGWVCAARLRERGVAVTVLAVDGLDASMSDHSARARAAWVLSGGAVRGDVAAYADAWPRLGRHVLPDLAVDCVLGTGAVGAPRGASAEAVRVLRRLRAVAGIVACDLPSGVAADTGAVEDRQLAVQADRTVTFGAAKRGLLLHPGAAHAGRVSVADLGPWWDLGAPWSGPEANGAWWATCDPLAAPRPWDAGDDKRGRGRVLVLAGSQRYGGAAALCGRAALRAGAGLVTVATSADPGPVLALDPGLMVRTLPPADDGVGGPGVAAIEVILEALADADAAVVGPGLGHEVETRRVVDAVLAGEGDGPRPRTVVLDADGLNVFRYEAAALADARCTLVLTPHERELARLLGVEHDQVVADRAGAAHELARIADAVVVAKGPGTVVVGADGSTWVVSSGGPELGTGGTGDVLSGMLGAAMAQDRSGGLDAHVAAAGTAHLHGLAGERAGARSGGRATASDLLDVLPSLLAELAARRDADGWRPR